MLFTKKVTINLARKNSKRSLKKKVKKMLIFFFFFLQNILSSNTHTHEGISEKKSKLTKFSIRSFSPKTIQGKGGDLVTIIIDKNISSLVFCKFGDKEVSGKKIDDFQIACASPRIQYSEVLLSISEDKAKWSLPVTISVIPDNDNSSLSFIIVVGLAILGISYSAKKILFGKKKRRLHKKKKSKRSTLEAPLDGKKRSRRRKQDPAL